MTTNLSVVHRIRILFIGITKVQQMAYLIVPQN
jgi:hypothetical protein